MPRVKRGVTKRARHNEVLSAAKGYYGRRKSNYSIAKTAVLKAKNQAFEGRKQRKRDLRSLWIQRINATVRNLGTKYSEWMCNCRKAGVMLDRKMMADLCVQQPQIFNKLFTEVNQLIAKDVNQLIAKDSTVSKSKLKRDQAV